MSRASQILIASGFLLTACTVGERTEEPEVIPTVEGPELVHTLPEGPFVDGDSIPITVSVSDDDGIQSVQLYHQVTGTVVWSTSPLETTGDGVYTGALAAVSPGVRYYFKAVDASPYAAMTFDPLDGQVTPYAVDVGQQALPIPWTIDFDDALSEFSHYEWGFTDYSAGFPGATWRLSQARSASGTWAARHRVSSTEEVIEDWLISPPLDLTSVAAPGVRWLQYGFEQTAAASLWISTGSRDPAEGAFEKLAEIDTATQAGWHYSPAIDLTPYASETSVHLAWVYTGGTVEWVLDDLEVGELDAELILLQAVQTEADPGDSVTLSVTLENTGANTAGDVVLSAEIEAENGVLTAPVNLGPMATDDIVTGDLVFDLDPDVLDNARFDVTLVAEDDVNTWAFDSSLLVGDPSIAAIAIDQDALGLVQIFVGSGDPSAPDVELSVVQDILAPGSYTWDVDISSHIDLLPPLPGPERWWVRVDPTAPGSLTGFTISYDGTDYVGADLGPYDYPDGAVFYLPTRPAPGVVGETTDPDPLVPGATVTWELVLENTGGPTVGLTTALVTTSDPDVTVTTIDAATLAVDGWESGEQAAFDVELEVAVSQNDDRPVVFDVVVTDAAESFLVTTVLEVPWAVLTPGELEVDDFLTGNKDGILDADEKVSLEVSLTNTGSVDTGSALSCTLDPGAAPVTVHEDTDYFGFIEMGQTRTGDDFSFTVDAGTPVGTAIDLALHCEDDAGLTYDVQLPLTVGSPPWQYLSVVPDPPGDSQGYDFDMRWVRYRVLGSTLQLELVSHTDFDPQLLFVEGWFVSAGATYDIYQIASQSGVATLQGWDYTLGPTVLSNPTVVTGSDHVLIEVDLGSAGLVVDSLDLAVGSGFCAGTHLCDHYPDGFGNPYVGGVSTDMFIEIQW